MEFINIFKDMTTLILALLRYSNRLECSHDSKCIARSLCNSLFYSSSIEYQEAVVEKLIFSTRASYSGFHDNGIVQESSQRVLGEKNQRRWSRWVLEIIAPSTEFAVKSKRNDDSDSSISSFSQHLTNIADRWSQLTFIQEVEDLHQHHVSLVLWNGLLIFERLSISLQDPRQRKLVATLVSGVSHRLGSMLLTLRQDGLRIAQQLARGLGQDDSNFDELIQDEIGEDNQFVVRDSNSDKMSNKKKELVKARAKDRSKLEKPGFLHPDTVYESDVEEVDEISDTEGTPQGSINTELNNYDRNDLEDDLSGEWKDELQVYGLEDDEEDLRATPRPLRLLDCLDLLRTGENHDHVLARHETALEELPSLIRNRPDDLADVAVSLTFELLRMENKFDISDFDTKREFVISTLLIEEPFLVGKTLTEQLFEESGLVDKLSILNSLQRAAFDLSGNKGLVEGIRNDSLLKTAKFMTYDQECVASMLSTRNELHRVGSKTCRIRSRSEQKARNNQFSEVAPMWFYSLVAGFLKHREDQALWTGPTGSILLACLFRCLAMIIAFSGSQTSQVLANDLLDLVWDFRTADVQEVRLAVLVAVSTSVAKLSNEKLINLLIDEGHLAKTLQEMSRTDPDKECRSLCQTITLSIHEILNSDI